jgi:micrococcal nuclease
MAYEYDPNYTYRVLIDRVVDGDTVDTSISLGFGIYLTGKDHARFRLFGIDTPETYGVKKDSEEYKAGLAAKEWLQARLQSYMSAGTPVWMQSYKSGKYGRYVGVLWLNQEDLGVIEKSVNAQLYYEGHATLYKNEPLPVDPIEE